MNFIVALPNLLKHFVLHFWEKFEFWKLLGAFEVVGFQRRNLRKRKWNKDSFDLRSQRPSDLKAMHHCATHACTTSFWRKCFSDVSASYFLLPFCAKPLLTWRQAPSAWAFQHGAFLTKRWSSVRKFISFNFEGGEKLERALRVRHVC